MAISAATVDLCQLAVARRESGQFLTLLLKWEAWLDARTSRRLLARLDERGLADIGLTGADLGRADPATF